jgi:phosphoribosylglycinamide formyltransferase-1
MRSHYIDGVRLAVLVSGSGTILQAMFDAGLPVTTVLSDRPCAGLDLAQEHGAAAELVDRAPFGGFSPDFDRVGFTATVAATLVAHQVDLVAMAGFGTVMTEGVHRAFPGRILNTHPSLLPAFPGWHGVRDALAAGVAETGCTVHLATVELDAGPILAQEVVPVLAEDSEATLHERIKVAERALYPATVAWALGELEAGRPIVGPARQAVQAKVGAGSEHRDARQGADPEMTS